MSRTGVDGKKKKGVHRILNLPIIEIAPTTKRANSKLKVAARVPEQVTPRAQTCTI
jgi:hypothetical protein